jgi:hypothetical protein
MPPLLFDILFTVFPYNMLLLQPIHLPTAAAKDTCRMPAKPVETDLAGYAKR